MDSNCETKPGERLVEQRALGSERPPRTKPKKSIYYKLIPRTTKTSFDMRLHVDRETLRTSDCGTDVEVCGCLDPQPEDQGGEPCDIFIYEDAYIYIELDEDFEWRWSAEFAAISTKAKPYDALYGELRYAEELTGPYLHKTEFSSDARLRFIRYVAHYNGPPKDKKGKAQPYCLNFDFRMKEATSGWLPLTLDPDHWNPPRNGGG